MEEIIKTLLLEGIDEHTIHKVLDIIEEEYEIVNEVSKEYTKAKLNGGKDVLTQIEKEAKENPTEENQRKVLKYKHKLNVAADHVANYHKNKAKKKYEESKELDK